MRGIAIILLLCGFGCATPSERVDARIRELAWTRHEVPGVGFAHAIYASPMPPVPQRLHVYIAGDGSPERASRFDPPDPTPENDPTFALMAMDPATSILLGRPCQHITGACDPLHWSLGRYGEPVVASMAVALRSYLEANGLPQDLEIVLIGFSGGGTLAMLLAERLPEAKILVSIAGNLDVETWATYHGHAPLIYSLDPAQRQPLSEEVTQLHLRGGRDKNVLRRFSTSWIEDQPNANERVFSDFDHTCCWAEIWPGVLEEIERGNFAEQNPLEGKPPAKAEGVR